MKKSVILLLLISICFSLFACSLQNTSEAELSTIDSQSTNESEFIENLTFSPWTLTHFVDDFGDEETETYIRCATFGEFSNTATTNADLIVQISFIPGVASEINSSGFVFRLLEYGDHPATYLSSDDITIKIKVGDEILTEELYGDAPNGDLLLIPGPILDKITHTLPTEDQEIRCIIEIGSSKYSFSFPTDGYANSFNSMMQSYGFEDYNVVEALNGKLFTRTSS